MLRIFPPTRMPASPFKDGLADSNSVLLCASRQVGRVRLPVAAGRSCGVLCVQVSLDLFDSPAAHARVLELTMCSVQVLRDQGVKPPRESTAFFTCRRPRTHKVVVRLRARML